MTHHSTGHCCHTSIIVYSEHPLGNVYSTLRVRMFTAVSRTALGNGCAACAWRRSVASSGPLVSYRGQSVKQRSNTVELYEKRKRKMCRAAQDKVLGKEKFLGTLVGSAYLLCCSPEKTKNKNSSSSSRSTAADTKYRKCCRLHHTGCFTHLSLRTGIVCLASGGFELPVPRSCHG